MHCLASCDRPRVTCHLPRERNCPNPLNFLHGQDKVVGASRGDALGDAASHIPLETSAKMKRNGRTNAGRREVRQQQLDHQGERHTEQRRGPRGVAPSHFHCFPNPVQLSIARWQPVASFSVRVTIGVAPALLAVSVSPPSSPARHSVSLFTTWSLLSAVGARRRERASCVQSTIFLSGKRANFAHTTTTTYPIRGTRQPHT